MGAGHEPSRMCVICRRRFAKSQLLRHVLSSSGGEGTLEADEAQKKPGRGWYVLFRARLPGKVRQDGPAEEQAQRGLTVWMKR